MTQQSKRFRYHAFISYSSRNKDWVRGWLDPKLKSAGLKICTDYECFEPGAPLITEMERAVLQSRKIILVITREYFQSEWTELENLLAQTIDPAARRRRLIPIILQDYTLPPRLAMLTPIYFTESTTQDIALRKLSDTIYKPLRLSRKLPDTSEELPFEVPTGTVLPDSPLYIERNYDQKLRNQVTREGSTTCIRGAWQMGKSSLLVRAVIHARRHMCTVVDFDLQDFDDYYLRDLDTLLRYLADMLYERLKLAQPPDSIWSQKGGAKDKLTSYIDKYILEATQFPFVFVMDEVDRAIGRPYQNDFFGCLRSWHNRRAKDAKWRKFNLVMSISTATENMIQQSGSPFNVGLKIRLDDFSHEDLWELNCRYGKPMKQREDINAW